MAEIISKIKEFLEESEYRYDYNEEYSSFDLGFSVDKGTVRVRIVGREEEDYMIIFVSWEGKVPTQSLPSVYPVLNDINFNTKFTTVSVDPQDGEITCHCGINTDHSQLSVRQVGVCLHMAVNVLSENIDQIMRAAWNAPSNADGRLN